MSLEQISHAKQIILKTYKEHLEKESRFQSQRIRELENALVAARTAYQTEFKAKQKEIKGANRDKTKEEREQLYDAERPTIMHKHFDPKIIEYERAAYYGTVSLGALLSDISQELRNTSMVMGSEDEPDMTTVSVGDQMGLGAVHVATYYKLNGRFKLFSQGVAGFPSVYAHRSRSSSHFVQDCYDVFIPRYVIRNLAERDLPNLNQPAVGMASRDGTVPRNQNFDTAVLNHLRAAEQGSSFFVSTTHLDRPIFGATGKWFYDQKTGQVVIDLSQVPQKQIVDVSSKRARDRFMKTTKLDWTLKFREDNLNYQRMAAARDTVRTGEVLVHDRIPRSAIVTLRSKETGGQWIVPPYAAKVRHASFPTPNYE